MRGMQVWRALGAGLVLAGAASAQGQVFELMANEPQAEAASVPGPRPVDGVTVRVDVEALRAVLGDAPGQRLDVALREYGLRLELPAPDGGMAACVVARSPVMEDGLAGLFPEMQTYVVQSVDGTATGRIELTQRGLTGMLRTPYGTWMIDPWQSADPGHAIVYWLADLRGTGDWECGTVGAAPAVEAPGSGYEPRVAQTLKTFRLAVACTGEFGVHHSTLQGHTPNVADPLAAIVTMVGRANVVFEGDLAVHVNLVANNNVVIFTDPAADPYPSTCGGAGGADCSAGLLNVNPGVLQSRLGMANFDVGHVVTRIAGGIAYLSSVCTSNKGGGVSGIPRGGDVDPLSALVLIHEMGHQFGANHTFSGTRGRCEGNVSLATAWEAGSGSSIMAYPGGCPVGNEAPTDNVAIFADPFYHHGSLREMRTFLTSSTPCAVQTSTGNEIPEIVSATTSRAIPPGTPFVLSASATDANSDVLTYSWEQYDSGTARPLVGAGSVDNGGGALFRIFPPVLSGERAFPRMEDVLAGAATPGEQLPVVTGVVRNFRVVVRDGRALGGATVQSGLVSLSIAAGTSPFRVISPGESSVIAAGLNAVAWSVGNTNVAPVSVSTVTIRLSTDGGATFPQVLGTFPNNGQALVNLAAVHGPLRLRLDADGSIFFAVSRPFYVVVPCNPDYDDDGDVGTDGDIEAFFACLAGACCAACPPNADFNLDGDVGTDADIEAFFRALAGGAC